MNTYTTRLFHSDNTLKYWCRIHVDATGPRRGKSCRRERKNYGIIQQRDAHHSTRIRVTFIRQGANWIAQCRGPHDDAIREVANRTQLAALIGLGRWIAEELDWVNTPPVQPPSSSGSIYDRFIKRPEPRRCPHCDRECEPGESLCGDSDCPRHDREGGFPNPHRKTETAVCDVCDRAFPLDDGEVHGDAEHGPFGRCNDCIRNT